MESYAAGEITPSLIEQTIGANFEKTVEEYGDNEALVAGPTANSTKTSMLSPKD